MLHTSASDVDDVQRAPSRTDPPHVGPTPSPVSVFVEGAIVSKVGCTSTTDVQGAEAALLTVIPSQQVTATAGSASLQ